MQFHSFLLFEICHYFKLFLIYTKTTCSSLLFVFIGDLSLQDENTAKHDNIILYTVIIVLKKKVSCKNKLYSHSVSSDR